MSYILLISIILQILITYIILKNIEFNKNNISWIILSVSICLMAIRRITTFCGILFYDKTANLYSEIIALVISASMLIAIWLILKENKHLKFSETQKQKQTIDHSYSNLFSIFNSMNAFVYISDFKNHEIIFANNQAIQEFGNFKNKKCYEYLQRNKNKECEFCTNNKIYNSQNNQILKPYTWEFKNTKNNRWYFIQDQAIHWLDGRIVRLEIAFDITKQKEMQLKIKENEERLRALINASDKDIICFKDGKGRWLIANEADLKLFGLENVDYFRKTDTELAEFTKPIYKKAFLTCEKSDNETWKSGKNRRQIEEIPVPEGGKRIFDVIKVPLFNKNNERKGIVVFGRDITEIKKLENQLIHSEKLSAIGELSAGIAHEFNNILTIISSLTDLISLDDDKNKHSEETNKIKLQINIAKNIISSIKNFSKAANPKFEPAYISDIINEIIQLQKLVIKKENISITKNINSESKIMLDKTQIYQVFLNLFNNSRYALKDINNGNININIDSDNKYETIIFEDNGVGIKPDIKKQIFNPFFTTKTDKTEKGTGLGLAISKSIVLAHKGDIIVESNRNQGTKFIIKFPVIKKEST